MSPLALTVLIATGFTSPSPRAETALPSSSSTVTLQSFVPGEFDFVLPEGSLIQTTVGNGIDGDSSQDWRLDVQGSVLAAADGIHLLSTTNNGAQITNSGSISAGGVGIALLNGGAVINEAAGDIVGSTGILFSSGVYSLNNAGRIEGSGTGLEITTDSASTFTNQGSGIIAGNAGVHITSSGHTVINQGTILGTEGTAVDISGNNNLLLLDDGATVSGDVNSSGTGNRIVLAGRGSIGDASSVISGFSSLEMNGLAWTLAGDVLMGNSSPSISVNQGKLTLTGNLNANSGDVEVALGAELQIGDGGIVGDLHQAHIQADGIVSFFRSDGALDLTDRVSGSGVLLFKGTGVRGESYYSFSNGDSEFYGNVVVGSDVRLRIGSSSPAPLANYFVENNSTLWFGSSGNFSSALFIEGQGWDDPGFGRLGALRLDSGPEVSGPVTLTGDARVTAVFSGYTGTISGSIGDDGNGYALEKTGDGLITLTGVNTYSGGTLINAGTLAIGRSESLGDDAGDVTLNHANATLSLLDSFSLNHNVIVGSQGGIVTTTSANTITGTLSGDGSFTKAGVGSLSLTGTGSGVQNVSVLDGELALAQSGAFTVFRNYTTASGASTSLSGTALLTVNGQFTQSSDSTLNLVLGSADPLISANTASLSGALNVTGLGANVPNAANYTLIHTAAADGISGDFSSISVGGAASSVDYVTFTGGVDLLRQNYTIGLRLTWYDGYTSTPENAHGTFTLSDQQAFFNLGVLLFDVAQNGATGWDGKSLTKAGQGTLVLSKQNQYTGDTLIQGGILRLEAENAVADSARVQIDDGAMLMTGEAEQLIHQLSGSGRIVLGQGLLTQYNEGGTTLFSGQISGPGSLKKTGDGTLILSADNHFAGTTTVVEGVLQLGDGGSTGSVVGNIVNDAALVFNRNSDLTYGGAISGGGQVTQAGSGRLTFVGDNIYSGVTVINSGELRLGAGGNSGSVAGNIVNHGVLTFNRADNVPYLGIISGEGAVNKMGAGSLTFGQSQSYQGDTTVSEGTLIVGDDGHSGVTLDSRRIDVLADATLGGYGQVNGSVNNQGTLAVADALPEFSDRQTGSFTVGGDLNNAGRIVMASVEPDSRLIVKGNYVGEGGGLTLSTTLAGDDSATDRLVILGDSGGSTSVVVNNAGGKGGQTVNGIQIVSVAGTSDGVFTLANRPVAGAYDYFLYQGTPSGNDGNWYLRSVLNQQDPVIRPEAGSYVANAAAASTLFALRLTDREVGEKNGGMWLRQVGGHTRSRDDSGQLRTQTNRYVVQGGGDLFSLSVGHEGSLSGGVMAGYGHTNSSTGSTMSGYDAKGSLNGYSTGIYSTWRQNAAAQRGAYLDAWLQYSWFKASVGGQGMSDERYNINGYSASVESGYRHVVSESATGELAVTPQLQAAWSGIKADDHTESNGAVVKSLDDDALQTRVGVELSRQSVNRGNNGETARFTAYIEANWLYNRKPTAVTLDDVAVRQQGSRSVGELKLGVRGALNARWDVWGNIGQRLGDEGYSDTSASLAVRYRF